MGKDVCLGLFLLLVVRHIGASELYVHTDAKTVRANIFSPSNYDPVTRPLSVTDVRISFNLRSIESLDSKDQSLTCVGWLTVEWEDTRLAWTPATHGHLQHVFALPTEMWKPELIVDNSVNKVSVVKDDDLHLKFNYSDVRGRSILDLYEGRMTDLTCYRHPVNAVDLGLLPRMLKIGVIHDDELHLRLKYTGHVEWEPPRIFNTHCELDITYYPFDRQLCSIEVASWGYHKSEVTLENLMDHVNMEDYRENGEWEVTGSSVERHDLVETVDGHTYYYPQVDFRLQLQRRPTYYVLNTILPVVISSFLMVLVFILPADSGEKVSFALTVLLALALLLTLISEHLPSTSLTTSILGLYIAFTLFLAAFSVLATVVILVFHHRPGYMPTSGFVPAATRLATAISCSSKPVCTPREDCTSKVVPLDDQLHEERDKPEIAVTWKHAAIIWDRFCLIFFFFLTTVGTLVFMLTIGVGGHVQDVH